MKIVHRKRPSIIFVQVMLLLCGLFLPACTETRYVGLNDRGKENDFPMRTVAYEIDRSFYDRFPDCVLILPPEPRDGITKDLSTIIEHALARHLGRRFERIVDRLERRNAIERYGIDIFDPSERRTLAKKLDCDTYIHTQILNPHMDYLLVWSQMGIDLDLRLKRVENDYLLWRARHKARRSEGGLPFSPGGLITGTIFSSRFAADREIALGLADDAIRRMVTPLPNTRTF